MNSIYKSDTNMNIRNLIGKIRELNYDGKYIEAIEVISDAMQKYPHSPEPHNLMGVIMEAQHNHVAAMKHFRAAWALDPTYEPARYNLETFGTFCHLRKSAYDIADCENKRGI